LRLARFELKCDVEDLTMKKITLFYLAMVTLVLLPVSSFAVSNAAVIFLTIEPGSRSGAMGHSYVAQADDAFANWWNPAMLAFNRKTQFAGMHSNWFGEVFDDMYYDYFAMSKYVEDVGNFGFSITYMTYGEQERTGEEQPDPGETPETFKSFDVSVAGTYAYQWKPDIGFGVTFKFIYSDLAPEGQGNTENEVKGQGTSFAFDLGYAHKDIFVKNLDFGLNFQNFGPNITYINESQSDPLPMNVKLGFSYTAVDHKYSKLTFNADMNKMLANRDNLFKRVFTAWGDDFTKDDFKSFDNFINSTEIREVILGFGAEYQYLNLLSVRAGYYADRAGEITGPSFGGGIHRFINDKYKLNVDFAMQPAGGLQDYNQTFTLRIEF